MSPALDPEEAAALAVLDSLGRRQSPDDTSVPAPEDEIEGVLRRLYGEAIGMLPYALEPVPPSSALKSALFGLTVGDVTQEVEPIEPEPAAPERLPERASGPIRVQLELPAEPARAARVRRSSGPWIALAAVLVLALVGAGVWVAYLDSELAAERTRLAWTEKEWKERAESADQALRDLQRRYDLVTSPAATVFRLHCPTGHGPAAAAHGLLFVAADEHSWQLEIRGLKPEPSGQEYQVWFLVGEVPRNAGSFNVRDGRVVFAKSGPLPPGTTGVGVSVEPKGGSTRPTSPLILVADPAVRL